MKDLTIYNVYVEMESQEQCDRMKKLCIENNLPYWKTNYNYSFYFGERENWFEFIETEDSKEFFVTSGNDRLLVLDKTKVTEEKFINLLKQDKND